MATGGTGDVLAGTIGALLAQGLAPFDAARLGVYLHGVAGELVGERIGDAGLLAGDLPDALPDRPQAPRAARRAAAQRAAARVRGPVATTRRRGGTAADRTPAPTPAGEAGAEPATASRRPPVAAREPIEARLARAGLPPLPRTAWLELDLDALRGNLAALRAAVGPGVRVEPVVKADAYGHGAVPIALALEAGGRRRAVGRDARRGAGAARRRRRPPGPRPVPDPAGAGRGGGLGAHRGHARAGRARGGTLAAAAAAAAGPARRRSSCTSSSRRGSAAAACCPTGSAALVDAVAAAPGVRLGGLWTHLAAAGRRRRTPAGQDARFARRARRARDRCGVESGGVARHVSGSGGMLRGDGVARWDAVRPGLATYGLVPTGSASADASAPAPRDAPAARSSRSTRGRCGSSDLPAGHGVSYGPAFVTERASRIATLPLGYGDGWRRTWTEPRVGARARRAGAARRAGGHGRRDGGRHRRPGRAGHRGRRVRAHRRAGRRADHRASTSPRLAERSATRWSPGCPADCRGCTMPPVHPWRSGTSREGGPSGAHRALERGHL